MMDEEELTQRLAMLRQEHRDLDVAIEALAGANHFDSIQILRLKKKKLQLKDQIMALEDAIHPDIIA